jgi:1L-myo-inositol 1-phosphate cytidylyltransferase / CDP-L-myo-inositol myo-inositolphosphotransferase
MALHDPQSAQDKPDSAKGRAGFRALIIPGETGADARLKVAGITLAERQRRQLLRLGASRVDQAGGESMIADGATLRGPVLLIEAGLLADERIIAAFLDEAERRKDDAQALLALGPDGQTGGLAWLPEGGRAFAWQDIAAAGAALVDLTQIDTYSPERRRKVPLLWERPSDPASARRAGGQVLAAAQKGCLDWPARFIHPPIENAFVRLLLPTPITPNMISVMAFLLGLYAAWSFATGSMWTGLLLALAIGPIDGIDGKLARTRVEFSPWGDLEHVGDKIVEYSWFAALAAAIGTGWAWALAALIVVTALAEALQGEFYRRLTGAQLDDAGAFERAYRLVSGRRNTFFWCLLPFAWFEAWGAGLVMIAVYAAANFFVMQGRFFIRLAEYGRAHSAAIAANLDATAYGMLDPADLEEDRAEPASVVGPVVLPSSGSLGTR